MTSEGNMTLERFRGILDIHGGDPDRWPEDIRAEALHFSQKDPQARDALKAATSFDNMMDVWDVPDIPQDFTRRLMAKVGDNTLDFEVHRKNRNSRGVRIFEFSRIAVPAALAASLALGVFLGTTGLTSAIFGDSQNVTVVDLAYLSDTRTEFLP